MGKLERESCTEIILPCPYLVNGQSTKHLKERNKDHKKEHKNKEQKLKFPLESESSNKKKYAVWMPVQCQNTHLNLHAPVFKPATKQHP